MPSVFNPDTLTAITDGVEVAPPTSTSSLQAFTGAAPTITAAGGVTTITSFPNRHGNHTVCSPQTPGWVAPIVATLGILDGLFLVGAGWLIYKYGFFGYRLSFKKNSKEPESKKPELKKPEVKEPEAKKPTARVPLSAEVMLTAVMVE